MTTFALARSRLTRLSGLLCLLAVVSLVWASAGHHHPAMAPTGTASQVEKACTVCAVFAGIDSPGHSGAWAHPTALVSRTPAAAAQPRCAPPALVAEGRAPPSA